jgi:8-oxo-dGTP diphosphatase
METVAAAVIYRKNTVLLARRKAGEDLAGFWEFPGGKVDGDESFQECLARELEEELGIKTVPGDILAEVNHEYPSGEIRLVAIETSMPEPDQPIRLSVHDKYVWAPVTALLEYNLAPADITVARHLISSL